MGHFRIRGPIGRSVPATKTRTQSGSKTHGTFARPHTKKREPTEPINLSPSLASVAGLRDGDVIKFDVSRYSRFFLTDQQLREKPRASRSGVYEVLFVNGMMGSPAKFRAQACSVAAISGGPVWGVYNASGESFLKGGLTVAGAAVGGTLAGPLGTVAGATTAKSNMFVDLLQCMTDKVQSTDLDQFKAWAKRKLGVPQATIEREMVENLTQYNPATGSLLKKLLQPGFENARIVAHSQGNIIVCNAVNAVAAVRGVEAIRKMRICAVASPVVFWSEAGQFGQDIVKTYAFRNDLVAWLGANFDNPAYLQFKTSIARQGEQWEGSEVADAYQKTHNPLNGLTHNFYAYLEQFSEVLSQFFD